jgi:hypothetical protein
MGSVDTDILLAAQIIAEDAEQRVVSSGVSKTDSIKEDIHANTQDAGVPASLIAVHLIEALIADPADSADEPSAPIPQSTIH